MGSCLVNSGMSLTTSFIIFVLALNIACILLSVLLARVWIPYLSFELYKFHRGYRIPFSLQLKTMMLMVIRMQMLLLQKMKMTIVKKTKIAKNIMNKMQIESRLLSWLCFYQIFFQGLNACSCFGALNIIQTYMFQVTCTFLMINFQWI